MEPYGFAPRAAVDGDAVTRAMEAGASDAEIEDLMDDMENTRFATDPAERREFVEAWKAAGMTCVFQNAGQESQDPLRLMRRLANFTYALDMLDDVLVRATCAEDIVSAKRQNKGALALCTCGVPLPQQWTSAPAELALIRVFFELGVRMMHLTYNRRNMIGDGCGETSNAGLSDFGRSVIAEMNRLGVIVDVAHSGWRTSLEAAKTSSRPVVASHSAAAALHPHFRSKPDDVIRAIADSGGLMGICAVPQFLGGSGDLNAMLDHIDYVARKFGVDRVAIATDYSYRSRAAGVEYLKIPKRRRLRAQWEALWPTPLGPTPPSQETMAWTNWPLFTVGLVKRGYSDADIQKIIGGNALRIFQTARPN
jgi:membrane dipeptidase